VKRRSKRPKKRYPFKVVEGQRETLEREFFVNVLSDGDLARREQLYRVLLPAANVPISIVSPLDSPLVRDADEDDV
jgi:hypothetical protein